MLNGFQQKTIEYRCDTKIELPSEKDGGMPIKFFKSGSELKGQIRDEAINAIVYTNLQPDEKYNLELECTDVEMGRWKSSFVVNSLGIHFQEVIPIS